MRASLLVTALVLAARSLQAQSPVPSDRDLVRATVGDYVEGPCKTDAGWQILDVVWQSPPRRDNPPANVARP